MSKCISRVTDETYAQQFGDNRHKFYLEFRCNRPCFKDMDVCIKCLDKSEKAKLQTSRSFDHGKINDPIPDKSHIYGGKWYNDGVKKWGQPPSEIIEFAIQYQSEARKDFIVIQSYDDLSKEVKQSNIQMARSKKVENEQKEEVKKRRKPKIVEKSLSLDINDANLQSTETNDNKLETNEQKEPIKRRRKPKINEEKNEDVVEEKKEVVEEKKSKKRGPRKKPEVSAYSEIVNTPQLIHKEVTLPTHLENTLEEFDTDGYEIEYVKLSLFELNNNVYFRDSNKNKLYKRIKEKTIGEYIGRYDKNTDSIITDIPDSDDEN